MRIAEQCFDGLFSTLCRSRRNIPGTQRSIEGLLKYHCNDYMLSVVIPVGIGLQRLAFIKGLATVHETDAGVGMHLFK